MPDHSIELTAADGHRLAAYRANPSGAPRGSVVVVQEIFGVNSHIRSVCDGFARDGYVAVAPALFDRLRGGVELGYSADAIEEGRQLKAQVREADAMLDIGAAVKWASSFGRTGIVGYCWGGLLSWLASASVDGLWCAVAYYGGGIPDRAQIKPRVPVIMHFGRSDTYIPVAAVERFAAMHPGVDINLYDAGHGFNCEQRASYHELSAAKARERTLEFFRQQLG